MTAHQPATVLQRGRIAIGAPSVDYDARHARLSFPVDGLEGARILFFRVDREFSDFLCERSDAAVAALLVPAMLAGKDLDITGPVSAKLAQNVRKSMVPLLLKFFPSAERIDVLAGHQSAGDETPGGHAVLTGLSNGIDSLATVWDHLLDPETPESERITHFLFNSVGSHGHSEDGTSETVFRERFRAVKSAADELRLPLIRTTSNLQAFYPTTKFQMSHTLRNTAVALALQSRAKTFLYSSSYEYGEVAARPSMDIATMEVMVLPLMSSEGLECRSVGSAYTRIEKTRIASTMDLTRKHLDLCVTGQDNCSTCWKCARTLLTLELLGRLDDYAHRFRLEKYRRIRAMFVGHVLAVRRQDPYSREIVGFMDEIGYRPTLAERLLGRALSVAYFAVRAVPTGIVRALRKRFGGPMNRRALSQGITGNILWDADLAVVSRFHKYRSGTEAN